MPSRRTSKQPRHTAERADTRSGATYPSGMTPPPPPSSASIDIASYPHLLSLILASSSQSTLAAILRCSKATFEAAAPLLYRNLRVTPNQIKALIETGWAPARHQKRGRGFSPTLMECFKHVITFHLEDYDCKFAYPTLPRGAFPNVTSVVLYVPIGFFGQLFTASPMFHAFGGHLYIRLNEDFVRTMHYCVDVGSKTLPTSFTAMTLLVPLAYRLKGAPTIGFSTCRWTKQPSRGRVEVSVVLLPWEVASSGEEHELQSSVVPRWGTYEHRFMGQGDVELPFYMYYDVNRYFGIEFAGVWRDELCLLRSAEPRNRPTGEFCKPFELFCNWLDSVAADTVFTNEERAVLTRRAWRTMLHHAKRHVAAIERIQARPVSQIPGDFLSGPMRIELEQDRVDLMKEVDRLEGLLGEVESSAPGAGSAVEASVH